MRPLPSFFRPWEVLAPLAAHLPFHGSFIFFEGCSCHGSMDELAECKKEAFGGDVYLLCTFTATAHVKKNANQVPPLEVTDKGQVSRGMRDSSRVSADYCCTIMSCQ